MKGSRFEDSPNEVRKSLESDCRQRAILRELEEARLRLGWTQAMLGKEARLSQMHVSAILSGREPDRGMAPNLSTFLDLAHAMGLEVLLVSKALVPTVEETVEKLARGREVLTYRGDDRPRYAAAGLEDADAGAEARPARAAGGDRPRYTVRDPGEG